MGRIWRTRRGPRLQQHGMQLVSSHQVEPLIYSSEKIEELRDMRMMSSVQHVSISAKTADWDRKFLEALDLIKLDLVDKTLVSLTFSGGRRFGCVHIRVMTRLPQIYAICIYTPSESVRRTGWTAVGQVTSVRVT